LTIKLGVAVGMGIVAVAIVSLEAGRIPMTTEFDRSLRSALGDVDVAEIERHTIKLATDENRDALRMAAAWEAHVNKIDNDRALPWSDRSVWNEFDLVAALILRDYFQEAVDTLPSRLRERVLALVAPVDDRFRGFTVPDSGKRIAKIGEIDMTGRGWWWFRVPDSGPITEDLARWNRFDT
jgi:hypothetical protein